MFERITLRGAKEPGDPVAPAILWAYHQAAELKSWTILRSERRKAGKWEWTLTATIATADAFCLGQTPLRFVSPRRQAGFWNWPIEGQVPYCHACRGWHPVGPKMTHTGPNQIRAPLGQPEF